MRLLLLRDAGSDTAPVIGRAQFEGRRRLRGKERKVSQLSEFALRYSRPHGWRLNLHSAGTLH